MEEGGVSALNIKINGFKLNVESSEMVFYSQLNHNTKKSASLVVISTMKDAVN